MTSKTPKPDQSFESNLRRSMTKRLSELDGVMAKHLADTAKRTAEIHDERKRVTAALGKLTPAKAQLKSPRKRARTPARKSAPAASA